MFMFCSYVTCFEKPKHLNLFIGFICLFMYLFASFSPFHQQWSSILQLELGEKEMLPSFFYFKDWQQLTKTI